MLEVKRASCENFQGLAQWKRQRGLWARALGMSKVQTELGRLSTISGEESLKRLCGPNMTDV